MLFASNASRNMWVTGSGIVAKDGVLQVMPSMKALWGRNQWIERLSSLGAMLA